MTQTPPAPGALLREKRIENGWTVPDVARALCLSSEHVEALENDNYTNLPGGTYVRGYWRSYAGLLGISIGEAVSVHKKHLRDTVSGRMPELETARRRKRTERSHHCLGLLFTLLSATFLLVIWYWQSPSADSPPAEAARPANPYKQPAVFAEPVVVTAAAGATGTAGTGDEALVQGETYSPTVPEPSFPDENNPRRPESEPDYGSYQTSTGALVFSGIVRQPPGVARAAPAPTPTEKIMFVVNEESWLEVQDDTGKRLIHRTIPGGRRVTLEGRAPFSVFIGNIEGVAVHYRDKPVPFPSQGDSLFARFKIGAP